MKNAKSKIQKDQKQDKGKDLVAVVRPKSVLNIAKIHCISPNAKKVPRNPVSKTPIRQFAKAVNHQQVLLRKEALRRFLAPAIGFGVVGF